MMIKELDLFVSLLLPLRVVCSSGLSPLILTTLPPPLPPGVALLKSAMTVSPVLINPQRLSDSKLYFTYR